MAEHEVLLYIYDLSQGLAAQLSLQMTGRHFPGELLASRVTLQLIKDWQASGESSSVCLAQLQAHLRLQAHRCCGP